MFGVTALVLNVQIIMTILTSLKSDAAITIMTLALALPAAYAVAKLGIGARTLLPAITNLRVLPLVLGLASYRFLGRATMAGAIKG